jgi:hypothetical protein
MGALRLLVKVGTVLDPFLQNAMNGLLVRWRIFAYGVAVCIQASMQSGSTFAEFACSLCMKIVLCEAFHVCLCWEIISDSLRTDRGARGLSRVLATTGTILSLCQLFVSIETAATLSLGAFIEFGCAAWYILFSGRSGLLSLTNYAALFLLALPLFTSVLNMGCALMAWSISKLFATLPAFWFGVHFIPVFYKNPTSDWLGSLSSDVVSAHCSVFILALLVPYLLLCRNPGTADETTLLVTGAPAIDEQTLLSGSAAGQVDSTDTPFAPWFYPWLLSDLFEGLTPNQRLFWAAGLYQGHWFFASSWARIYGCIFVLFCCIRVDLVRRFVYFLVKKLQNTQRKQKIRTVREKATPQKSIFSTLKSSVGFGHVPPLTAPNVPTLTAVPASNITLVAVPMMFRQRSDGKTHSESLLVQWTDSHDGGVGDEPPRGVGDVPPHLGEKAAASHSSSVGGCGKSGESGGEEGWVESSSETTKKNKTKKKNKNKHKRRQPAEYEVQHTHHADINLWGDNDDDDGAGRGAIRGANVSTIAARAVPADTSGTRRFTIGGLIAGNAYRVRVRCRDEKEWSEWSTSSGMCHTARDTLLRSGEKLYLDFLHHGKAIEEHVHGQGGDGGSVTGGGSDSATTGGSDTATTGGSDTAATVSTGDRSDSAPSSSESFLGRIGNEKDWVTVGWSPPHTPCSLLNVNFGGAQTSASGYIYGGDVVQVMRAGKILFGKSTTQYLGWSSDRNKGASSYFVVKGVRAEERLREGHTFELESQRWSGCKVKLSSQLGSKAQVVQAGIVYLMLHNTKTNASGGSSPGAACSKENPEGMTTAAAAAAAAAAAVGSEIVVSATRISTGGAPSLSAASSVIGGITAVSQTREEPLSQHSAEYKDIAEYIQQSISSSLGSPPRYSIVSAVKIYSPVLRKYLVEVADVKQRNGRTKPLPRLRGRFSIGATKLDKSVNECYLFHGCKCSAVL